MVEYTNYNPLPTGYKLHSFYATEGGLGDTDLTPDGTAQAIILPEGVSGKAFMLSVTALSPTYDYDIDNVEFLFSASATDPGIPCPKLGIGLSIGKTTGQTLGYVTAASSTSYKIRVLVLA